MLKVCDAMGVRRIGTCRIRPSILILMAVSIADAAIDSAGWLSRVTTYALSLTVASYVLGEALGKVFSFKRFPGDALDAAAMLALLGIVGVPIVNRAAEHVFPSTCSTYCIVGAFAAAILVLVIPQLYAYLRYLYAHMQG